MWIVSGPRVYLAVFFAGMFCGFALGVHATAHSAEIVTVHVSNLPQCPSVTQHGHGTCFDGGGPVSGMGQICDLDKRPAVCISVHWSQLDWQQK